MKNTGEAVLALLAGIVVFFGTLVVVNNYVNMPAVGITESGECKWIEQAPKFERVACPDELPAKYMRVNVK